MSTTIYVVMVDNRHRDTEPFLFTDGDAAIAYAEQRALDLDDEPDAEPVDGWLYSAVCGNEGDAVWVLAKTVDQP